MASLSTLGYCVMGVSKLDEWEIFATSILGMQVGQRVEGHSLALRMDENAQRILLEQSADDDLTAAGWQLDTEEELEEYVRQLRDAGIDVTECGAQLAQRRRVEKLYTCNDPNGYTHEFYFGPAVEPMSNPFRSQVLVGPGFETGVLGIGHILTIARDYRQSVDFYTNILGLKISDYIRQEVEPGKVVDATFMHAATGRHHSLATAQFPSQKRLNHIMVQVRDVNDVGMAFDRCAKAGVPIHLTLGHHPNDQMFSFYMQTPSGFGLEFGAGGIVIDDANWTVVNYSQLSNWGHKRIAAATA
ncbi:MAG: VOC family protein [Pseudomonadota bacterium]